MRRVPFLTRKNSGRLRVAASLSFNAQEHLMLDILMSALALAFFAAAIGYTYACERL
jgi:hypothetical protein